jgi:hypothetical protein
MASQANAIPEWVQTTPTFYQISNNNVAAGLVVQAEAPRPMLGIGGGFTINCTMNSLVINAQEKADLYDFFGPEVTLNVPTPTPGIYVIPGWSSIPAGSCGGQCSMQWRAEAVDAVLSFSASISGVGSSFTLLPAGGIRRENTIILDICRSGTPQCCTPGCQLP